MLTTLLFEFRIMLVIIILLWFGYVTAIMTSIFLSLIGFYLVNSGIKTDIKTKVGQITATTRTTNFTYLISKTFSNFLVLLTIVGLIFSMSIILFFLYNDGFPFEFFQFLKPYIIITIPAMFFIAVLAIVFEVLLGKYSVIQNIGFFFLFSFLMTFSPKNESQFSLDIFGSKIVMHQLEEKVKLIIGADKESNLSIGYVLGNVKKTEKFHFNEIDFPSSFIISRFIWILLSIGIILIISPLFHRFNLKEKSISKKETFKIQKQIVLNDINISNLLIPKIDYSIFPLIKTELLLLIRQGKRWLWLINCLGMILLAVLPLEIAHQLVLPILWFLQVSRLSTLTSKEIDNKVHFFTYTSYKPLSRLLLSQILSGIILILFLAIPLIIRFIILLDTTAVSSILLGGIFIVLLASLLGILTKGKKLFEVLFFMVTYANINKIPFIDYFGSLIHNSNYNLQLLFLITLLGNTCFFN